MNTGNEGEGSEGSECHALAMGTFFYRSRS